MALCRHLPFFCFLFCFRFFAFLVTYLTQLLFLKHACKFSRMTAWPVSDEVERGLMEMLSRNINLCAEDNQENTIMMMGRPAEIRISHYWLEVALALACLVYSFCLSYFWASNAIEGGGRLGEGEGNWRKFPSWLKGKVARDTVRQGFFKFHFIKIPLTW